jgi:hypothetical protein
MANETVEKLKRNWFYVLVGALILFALINFTLPWVYKTGCCTYNGNRSCGTNCSGGGGSGGAGGMVWSGECTREINDKCCGEPTFDVRMCNGQTVNDPRDCYSLYCMKEGTYCGATYGITGQYRCTCMITSEGPR